MSSVKSKKSTHTGSQLPTEQPPPPSQGKGSSSSGDDDHHHKHHHHHHNDDDNNDPGIELGDLNQIDRATSSATTITAPGSNDNDDGAPQSVLVPTESKKLKKKHTKKSKRKASQSSANNNDDDNDDDDGKDPVEPSAPPAPSAPSAPSAPADPKEQIMNATKSISDRQDAFDRVKERNKELEPVEKKSGALMYEPPKLLSMEVDENQNPGNTQTVYYDTYRCIFCCLKCCKVSAKK